MRPADTYFKYGFLLSARDEGGHLGVSSLPEKEAHHVQVAVFGRDIERRLSVSVPPVQDVVLTVYIVHVLLWIVIYHLFNDFYTVSAATREV